MDEAEGLTCPRELVFVDLETTGANAAFHRITEIGVLRMIDDVVVEEWSSLVNPESRIPSFIEEFTGISNEMVADAPRFRDIAAQVLKKLQPPDESVPGHKSTSRQPSEPPESTLGHESEMPHEFTPGLGSAPVFVAHNARFDYSFLRTEFRRAGIAFSAPVLCTVKLSRRLFPEFQRHNLDVIMERHQLSCSARHRALGDARVLKDFWRKLRADISPQVLASATHAVLHANRLPAYLPAGLADELPEGPGVYRFLDGDGVLLYIGRSASLRARVLGHFSGDETGAREQRKARQVRHIDWQETAGVLGAQLKEADWIKRQKPLYNKRVKETTNSVTLQPYPSAPGIRITPIDEVAPAELARCFGVFHCARDARKALSDIARAHSLCLKVLGLEDGHSTAAVQPPAADGGLSAGSCLAYQLGKCKGACVGKEPTTLHNVRLQMALAALKLKAWPFPGRIALREGRDDTHVLDHWTYLGTAHSEDELSELAAEHPKTGFDVDVYRILVRHLAKNPGLEWQDLRAQSMSS